MRLRTLELSVGLLLLLGPLGYALTLEPEVVEVEVERVVEVERPVEFGEVSVLVPGLDPIPVQKVEKVEEVEEVEKAEAPVPASVEPALEPEDRLQFAAVTEAGLV